MKTPAFLALLLATIARAVYAVDFNLTKQLGPKDSPARTAEQTAIAQFWADGPGTVTPPGHWNVIARDLALQRRLSLVENARLFALLNIAQADAAILCWDCKYDCNFWRPITAIQNADADKNPATEKDANWTPLLAMPPFPEYTSGHSTFSGAAAAVLAAFFGSDETPFSATSEAMQGFSRTCQSFSEAAAEAGLSRIFGGIHFMSANTQGLASGHSLGEYVTQNFLRPRDPRNAELRGARPSRALVAASRRDELSEKSESQNAPSPDRTPNKVRSGEDAETSARDGRAPQTTPLPAMANRRSLSPATP